MTRTARLVSFVMLFVMAASLTGLAQTQTASSAQTTGRRASQPPAPATPININTATASELEALPGVGPAMAERIVEYRQKNGAFKKIEDLMNVKGIGEKSFLKLKPLVTIAPAKLEARGVSVKLEAPGASVKVDAR
jgi:competence protein ComEA